MSIDLDNTNSSFVFLNTNPVAYKAEKLINEFLENQHHLISGLKVVNHNWEFNGRVTFNWTSDFELTEEQATLATSLVSSAISYAYENMLSD